MGVLSELEPKKVFQYFEEICSIPHPSYKEKKISDYLVSFAKEHHLEYMQDELYNVIMIAPATSGYENEEPIIIQGHMDMVCEKTSDCTIDFENDGLTLQIDGDDVTAQGTTLGGDDGIAVAYALAILDSPEVAHPKLEVIITVSEEVGMEGARGIDISMLEGHKLLNIDSENEGVMTVSCAGGNSTVVKLPVRYEAMTGQRMILNIDGCMGGHSGVEIDQGRSNPNLSMGRLMLALKNEHIHFALSELSGGAKQNAIPRQAKAAIITNDAKRAKRIVQSVFEEVKNEYRTADPGMKLTIEVQDEVTADVVTSEDFEKLLLLLNHLPRGIQAMSMDIRGLVETSLNLGILRLEPAQCVYEFAVRSSVATARDEVAGRIRQLAGYVGATVEVTGIYPPWEFKKDSVLREDAIRLYQEMYGSEPVVEAIHAGLECGLLAGKIPDLDAISIGPDIKDIHTTEEALSISSTKRVYEYILRLLAMRHFTLD